MAVAGGTMPAAKAYKVVLRDGVPVVVTHSDDRALGGIQNDMEAAEAILRSGLYVWVPSSTYMALLKRMAPQGALADVPARQSSELTAYVQFDDEQAAEGPPVYDSRTCAQRHDAEFQALKMEVELQGRRIAKLETKLAQEVRLREALQKKLSWWEADS